MTTLDLSQIDAAVFWGQVDVRSNNECWNWNNAVDTGGYGKMWFRGTHVRCSRVAWVLTYGNIPPACGYHGMRVCHSCDNRRYCNPMHLFLATQGDNLRDRTAKGRQAKGTRMPQSKINESDAAAICEDTTTPTAMLSDRYGMVESNIRLIRRGRIWKHVTSDIVKRRHNASEASTEQELFEHGECG